MGITTFEAVDLLGITKTYSEGGAAAVSNVTLHVRKQEILTLLGPSGCGKTTLLRLVAGLILPDEGDIYIHGERVNDVPTHRRGIGLVFQSYALFPHMTIRENIEFGLRRKRTPASEMARKVKEIMEVVELEGHEERYPKQLSGGQQQRVALARALVIEPRLMLLDEPLSNLDLKLRLSMQIELKRILKRTEVTSIYVTHDQGEALSLSDRIAIMNRGEVAQVGLPREIYERPSSRFTADFVGESNLFEGSITETNGQEVIVRTADHLIMRSQVPEDFTPKKDSRVHVLIRPEDVQLKPPGQPPADNSFKGFVDGVSYKGNCFKYYVRINGHLVSSDQPRDFVLNVGDEVRVEWRTKDALIVQERD